MWKSENSLQELFPRWGSWADCQQVPFPMSHFFLVFQMESCYIAQAGLEYIGLLALAFCALGLQMRTTMPSSDPLKGEVLGLLPCNKAVIPIHHILSLDGHVNTFFSDRENQTPNIRIPACLISFPYGQTHYLPEPSTHHNQWLVTGLHKLHQACPHNRGS